MQFGGEGVFGYRLTPADERRLLVLLSDIAPLCSAAPATEPSPCGTEVEHVLVLVGRLDVDVGGTHAPPRRRAMR